MVQFREALQILMDSPLYWSLDYIQRLALVRRFHSRQGFILAMGGSSGHQSTEINNARS